MVVSFFTFGVFQVTPDVSSAIQMWIFGYGSLIWKTDFPFKQNLVGYINGYDRRFYQYSSIHRGTPDNPGRVVTLVPNPKGKVYGIAYEIDDQDVEMVLEYLDKREQNGYERKHLLFHPKNPVIAPFKILVYIAGSRNQQYAGPADDQEIAKQIACSLGISGSNAEYVFNLANAMRKLAPNIRDDHLFNIEREILSYCASNLLDE